MVLKRSLEREDVLAKLFERYLHIKAPEGADVNGLCVHNSRQNLHQRLARGDALVVVQPLELDAGKSVHGRGMGVAGLCIRLAARDGCFRRGYLTREVLQQPVLELVLLALVTGLEQPQFCDLHVQVMR